VRLSATNFLWQSFCIIEANKNYERKKVVRDYLDRAWIAGLIYTAIVFMNASGGSRQVKSLIVYGVLGAIFFFTGIGLVKGTSDDARPPV